jgi:hypothetical protein
MFIYFFNFSQKHIIKQTVESAVKGFMCSGTMSLQKASLVMKTMLHVGLLCFNSVKLSRTVMRLTTHIVTPGTDD